MPIGTKPLSIVLVVLFLGSLTGGFTSVLNQTNPEVLDDEPDIQMASQATSPGHVVFGQYISSDNCGHCSKNGGGSDAHHSLKQLHPDEYVYVTYMSASYTDTDTSRAGNVGPYNWAWSRGGAPDAYFGDRTDGSGGPGSNGCNVGGADTSSTSYDATFSNGGCMMPASTVNNYGMSAAISQSGSFYNIDISYRYTGSGSSASNMKLYAALVDEDCTGYSYSSGIPHGYNCWMAWLTSGDTYKSKNAGSGNAFASVNPTSTSQTVSWTSVPSSVVPGGLSKAIVVGVLMTGNSVSSGGSSPHVYHAVDSTMGPKMDLSIPSFTASTSAGDSYKRGDVVTLDATVANTGDLTYNNGGSVKFYYILNGNKNYIGQGTPISSMATTGSTSTMSVQKTFDTSVLPENGWKTVFGAELSTSGETVTSNNQATVEMDHDRPPTSNSPQVIGSTDINRGEYFSVLAKGSANDNVDSIDTLTFDVEISPAGTNQWSSSVVTGGTNILYLGTPSEGREYYLLPTVDMPAGLYDIRSRAIDARGQTSGWSMTTNAFDLTNAPPSITPNQVSPVPCDVATKVDMTGIITDPETPLSALDITSNHASFVDWHPLTTEVEVLFAWDATQGCPLGQQGIEIFMDDGADYSEQGALPYGTLLFNVLENGQPRWQALPTQIIDEGSIGTLSLLPFLSDTDSTGNIVSAEDLTLEIIQMSTNDVFEARLEGTNIVFSTVDDDVNGELTVTIRASDGDQYADQTLIAKVNPINDPPRLDMESLQQEPIKLGTQRVVNLMAHLTDVDNLDSEAFITVSSDEQGAAKYNPIDGTMTLNFQNSGTHDVIINAIDRYDSNTYTLTVEVFDAYPLYVAKESDGGGHMYIIMENAYIDQIPTANIFLTDTAPTFTSIETTWNICNDETGTCDGLYEVNLDITRSMVGWELDLDIPSLFMPDQFARPSGSAYKDYYQVSVKAVDTNNNDYKSITSLRWNILEELPPISEMDEITLNDYIDRLADDIAALETQSADALNEAYKDEVALIIDQKRAEYNDACADPRANCPSQEMQAEDSAEKSHKDMNLTLILGIVGAIIGLALAVGLFLRKDGRYKYHETNEVWTQDSLPIHDTVANSMYGGAAQIFQQPIPHPHAHPAPLPVVPPMVHAGPPLPPGGLPAGWTFEQWQYYGQQYLDRLQQ